MEYSHSDAELVKQPIGYWSWAAYKAVVTQTRGAMAELGTNQPQWWVLSQVAGAATPMTREEVSRVLRDYLDTGEDTLDAEIGTTVERGWTTESADGRLHLTAEGRTFYHQMAAVQGKLLAERHVGISDEEYLTTLKVLQRFIHNTGGQAWHH
ncbi:MarR family winged helix-turn-helix transcriptional regulator [Kitasatospora misakiensis]|uniref:MarR family winged helix-turn-helix transcriptional regulator n=1 Tax=Kitasatospora misakiensis TaxID=67330 RepID=A0ABW0X1F7_9ACTN